MRLHGFNHRFTPMATRDLFDDGQAQAAATGLLTAAPKALKRMRHVIGQEAGAIVLYGQARA